MKISNQFKTSYFKVPPYFRNIRRSKEICLQCWKIAKQKRYSLKNPEHKIY